MQNKWLVALAVLMVAACQNPPGPIPVPGPNLVDPTITLGAATLTLYCDGSFEGSVPVTATYPAPPAGSVLGKAVLTGVTATTQDNIDNLSFGGTPMTFTANNQTVPLSISGKLTDPCKSGKLQLSGSVTFENNRSGGAQGGGQIGRAHV